MVRYSGGVRIRRAMQALRDRESGSVDYRAPAVLALALATGCYEATRFNYNVFGGVGYKTTGRNKSTSPAIPDGAKPIESNPYSGGVGISLDSTGSYLIVTPGSNIDHRELGFKFYEVVDGKLGAQVIDFENDFSPINSSSAVPLTGLIRRAPGDVVVLGQVVYRKKGGEDVEEPKLAIKIPKAPRNLDELPSNNASSNQADRVRSLYSRTAKGLWVKSRRTVTANGVQYTVEPVESLLGVADIDPDTNTKLIANAALLDAVREKAFEGKFPDSLKDVYVVLDLTAPGYHLDNEAVGSVRNPVKWVRLGRESPPEDPIKSKIMGLSASDSRIGLYHVSSVLAGLSYANQKVPVRGDFAAQPRSTSTHVTENVGKRSDLEDWRRTAGSVVAFPEAVDVLESAVNDPTLTKKLQLVQFALGPIDAAKVIEIINAGR